MIKQLTILLLTVGALLTTAVEIKRPIDVGFAPLQGMSYAEAREICEPFLSRDGKLGYARSRNMLIIHDFPEKIARIKKILLAVEVEPVNVRIDVTFDDVSERTASAFDVEPRVRVTRGNGTIRVDGAPRPGRRTGNRVPVETSRIVIGGNVHDRGHTRVDGRVDIRLGAGSETTQEYTNQFVMAGNGKPARIWVGETVHDTVWIFDYGVRHGWWRPELVQRELGASLYVKPRVLPNDHVEIEVYPRVTMRGEEHMSVDVKEVSTQVIVRSGQTVQIGGLGRNTRQVYRRLFGISKVFNGSNLAISLTPTIIRMPKQLKRKLDDERRTKREASTE
ncbi:MAG: hypothetical protein HN742_22090 [Lentisphaerae bacterium]|nr:hypothetical protein [Lentisphaerota bacterium]MBT4822673.1 hypothetical protein [Lentisphaerota bacterium]MBT5609915.1 hypothetical protein [Lentisphaerota bacterium]MBT7058258.1 hypothetical protein [Lentisphaerota bacterium]MBT7844584.1 hypothetical protein [Lentisphaerota bacterium]